MNNYHHYTIPLLSDMPPPKWEAIVKAGIRHQRVTRREAATKALDHNQGGKPPPAWEAIMNAGGRHQHVRLWRSIIAILLFGCVCRDQNGRPL